MTLNESDRALLSLALRIAAMQFLLDAKGVPDLAQPFNQQNRDAIRLAELIEDASTVEVKL